MIMQIIKMALTPLLYMCCKEANQQILVILNILKGRLNRRPRYVTQYIHTA